MKVRIVAFVLALASAGGALAQSSLSQYEEKERGWFWKEPIPEPPQPVVAPPTASPTPQKPAGPKPLSSAWVKEMVPKYTEAAINDPSPQNIRNFLWVQRLALDMGQRFSQAVQRVSYQDPLLDPDARSPSWQQARMATAQNAETARRKILKGLSADYGIWFFFRSDCAYCHLQAPVLANLAGKHGFSVLPISVDGQNLPKSPFQKFYRDSGQAAKLGVQQTPTLYLVRAPDVFIPIAQSAMALSDIENRIIELAADNNVITANQYESTLTEIRRELPPLSRMPNADVLAENPELLADFLSRVTRQTVGIPQSSN